MELPKHLVVFSPGKMSFALVYTMEWESKRSYLI